MAPGKGEQRKAALVRAAADVLLEQGFDAVTHRAVAAHAGLPLAATTYYFASREVLLEQALRLAAQEWSSAGRARLQDAAPREPARLVLDVVSGGRTGEALSALYQRYLESARRPGLRPVVAELDREATALVAQALGAAGLPDDLATAQLVLATADGLLLGALAHGRDDPLAHAQEPMGRLLGLLRQRDATSAVSAL